MLGKVNSRAFESSNQSVQTATTIRLTTVAHVGAVINERREIYEI